MIDYCQVQAPQIFQAALFWTNSAVLETGTFTSSNAAKLLPGKKYRSCAKSTKMHVSKIALMDSVRFLARIP